MSKIGRNLIFIILPIVLLFAYLLFNGADNRIQAQNNNSCTLWEKNDSTATFSGQIEYFSEKDNRNILLENAAELKISFQYGSGSDFLTSYDVVKKEFIFSELKFNTNKAVAKLTINAPGFIGYEEELLFSNKENKIRKTGDYLGNNPAIRLEKSPYKLTAYSGVHYSSSAADFSNEAGYKVTIFDESRNKITEGVTQRANGPQGFYSNKVELSSDKFVSGQSYYAQYVKNNQIVSVIHLFPSSVTNSPAWQVDLFTMDKKIIGTPYIITGKVLVANTNFSLPGTEVYIEQNGKKIPISSRNSFFGHGSANSDLNGLSGSIYQIDSGLNKGSATLVAKYANQFEYKKTLNISSAINKQDISINIPIICNKTVVKDIDVSTPGVDVTLKQNEIKNTFTTNLDGGFRNFTAINPEPVYGFNYLGFNFSPFYSYYSIDARKLGLSCDYQTYNTNSTCNFKNSLKPETKLLDLGEVKYQLTPNVNNVSNYDILDEVKGAFYLGDRGSSGSRTSKLNKQKPQNTANNVSSDKIEIPLAKYNTIYGKILPPEGESNFRHGAIHYKVQLDLVNENGEINNGDNYPLNTYTNKDSNFAIFGKVMKDKKYRLSIKDSEDKVYATQEIKFSENWDERHDIAIKLTREAQVFSNSPIKIDIARANMVHDFNTGNSGCEIRLVRLFENMEIDKVKYMVGAQKWVDGNMQEKYVDKKTENVYPNGKGDFDFLISIYDDQVNELESAGYDPWSDGIIKIKFIDQDGKDVTSEILQVYYSGNLPSIDTEYLYFNNVSFLSRGMRNKQNSTFFAHLLFKADQYYSPCDFCKYYDTISGYICDKDNHLPNEKEAAFSSAISDVVKANKDLFKDKPRPNVLAFQDSRKDARFNYYDMWDTQFHGKYIQNRPPTLLNGTYGLLPKAEEYILAKSKVIEKYSLSDVKNLGYHEAAHMKHYSINTYGYSIDSYGYKDQLLLDKKIETFYKIIKNTYDYNYIYQDLFFKGLLDYDSAVNIGAYAFENNREFYATSYSTAFSYEPEIRRRSIDRFLFSSTGYQSPYLYNLFNSWIDELLKGEQI